MNLFTVLVPVLLSVASLCLALANSCHAQNTQQQYDDTWQHESLSSMSNQELLAAAEARRLDESSATHQALNYQWMAQHANETGAKRSNKALRKMLKKSLKSYWVESRHHDRKRYSSSSKKPSKLDYGLKVSGGQLKLALEHRFF